MVVYAFGYGYAEDERNPAMADATAPEHYGREGYLFPFPAITAGEAAAICSHIEAVEDQSGEPLGALRSQPHLVFTWAAAVVRNAAILDVVAGILGPDVLCWEASFFMKDAHSPNYVSWHQDARYWGLSPPKVLTAWVAITPSTKANGAMRVLPGSHHGEIMAHADTFAADNILSRGQVIAEPLDEDRAVDLVLEPGEMSVHDVRLAHESAPNGSADRRIGMAIRYMAPDVRQTKAATDWAMVVRGSDRFSHFEHLPVPTTEMAPEALALHEKVRVGRMAFLFQGAERHPEERPEFARR
jgi:non-heme Fe2+,alpha-ketoglutarate-dependent halogenase